MRNLQKTRVYVATMLIALITLKLYEQHDKGYVKLINCDSINISSIKPKNKGRK